MVTRGVVTAARTSNCAVFAYSPLLAVARLGCGTSNYVVILLVVTRGVVAAATRITALFLRTRHYSPRLGLAVGGGECRDKWRVRDTQTPICTPIGA